MEIIGHFQTSLRRALQEIAPDYAGYRGLVICGSHSPKYLPVEDMIARIRVARETKTPFLGICFGHQLAAIEYARNILHIEDATSEEFGEKGTFVVQKLPKLKVGLHDGETYWSNYHVVLSHWDKPNYFFTTQSHPEYQSGIGHPHPLLLDFLNLCKNQ